MGVFNWFGEQQHNVFDYKPIYYDKEKEEIKKRFAAVDGSLENKRKSTEDGDAKAGEVKASDSTEAKSSYVPGSYIKGSMRDGNYQKSRKVGHKGQNFIGLAGLLLVFIILYFIAKFYSLL